MKGFIHYYLFMNYMFVADYKYYIFSKDTHVASAEKLCIFWPRRKQWRVHCSYGCVYQSSATLGRSRPTRLTFNKGLAFLGGRPLSIVANFFCNTLNGLSYIAPEIGLHGRVFLIDRPRCRSLGLRRCLGFEVSRCHFSSKEQIIL